VDYSDPFVPTFPKMRRHHFDLKSVPVSAETLKKYDCVLIVTNHDAFDYALIKKHSALIVDTRGVYLEKEPHIVKA